ncbi:hypothetical protein HF086_002287 [Spodoptera exigua]|uniref:RNA-directed DNA polymerase n=1 Tax=Spodoptera exigua TaxID=7107 RepID=A0A922SNG9_SPOEX|nr:hypothetical protein HF086_002287 [Spodoptera exigua]
MGGTQTKEETVVVQNAAGGTNNTQLEEVRFHISTITILMSIITLVLGLGVLYFLLRMYRRCHVRWINQELYRSALSRRSGARKSGPCPEKGRPKAEIIITDDIKKGNIGQSEKILIDKFCIDFESLYKQILDLCAMSDTSSSEDTKMESFNLKVALTLVPLMTNDNECSLKQLIDNIEYYSSLLASDECKKKLVQFVLKIQDYGNQLSELFVDLTVSQAEGNLDTYKMIKPLNEKMIIKRFADGLRNRRLSTIISARNYGSIKDAIQGAKDEETSITGSYSGSGEILIDTGATISALKYEYVLEQNIPVQKEDIVINGIGGKVHAIGYVCLTLSAGGHHLKRNKFYVFDTLPCRANGIIGQDFINKHSSILDFSNHTITLLTQSNLKIVLPLLIHNDGIEIFPRCESIHYLKTDFTEECVVHSKEISDGIFLAGCIATPVNGRIPIKILNTTDRSCTLTDINPCIEKISLYNVCNFDKSQRDASRVKQLFSVLNLKHLNKEEQISIEKLCAKYSDIFYLPGDRLTTTRLCDTPTVWSDQPNAVSSHNTRTLNESVELRFADACKLETFRKSGVIGKESKTFIYIPNERTVFVKYVSSPSQISPAEFVRELHDFCESLSITEVYIIKTNKNNIFIEKLLNEVNNLNTRTGPHLHIVKDVQRIENKDDKRVILNDFHLLPTSGHAGMRRMFNNIKKYYYWVGLENDIQEFIKRCDKCQKQKYSSHNIKQPMEITSTAHSAFEKIYIDLVGPLDKDDYNYSYILTLQCELTKYIEAYPLVTKRTEEVAKALVHNFILRYGVPKVIATDRGTEFLSSIFKEVCNLLHIKQLNSTAYHHQSIGALENTHKHLNSFLRIQTDNHPETWSTWLPFWSFCYNTSVHSATKYSPYELVFGKKCSLPSNLTNRVDPLYNIDYYPFELKFRLQKSQKDARDNLLKSKLIQKERYDRNINPIVYHPDDLILVKNNMCNKLDNVYSGPYKVVSDESPNVKIIKNGKIDVIHKNRTKLYHHNQ